MSNDVKEEVRLKVLQYLQGQTLEKNKLEFKSKWYDLSSPTKQDHNGKEFRNKDYYEFLKDCCSIINSYGRDEGFIIIGVREDKTCVDTHISDSGRSDSSKIRDLIIGNVDKAFLIDIDYLEVNGKNLSVIRIPPSADKPHIIKEYFQNKNRSENVIFVRSGSGTHVATRGDIDRMYWERPNIVLDKKIEVSCNLEDIKFLYVQGPKTITMVSRFTFENLGTRTLHPTAIFLKIEYDGDLYVFRYTGFMKGTPRLLHPNVPQDHITEFEMLVFSGVEQDRHKLSIILNRNKDDLKYQGMTIRLSNHEEIFTVPRVAKILY